MKVVTVLGARPQFIKAAAVFDAMTREPSIETILIHTGQHYDDAMSAVFFEELGLPRPDRDLGLGTGSHGAMTGRMLEAVEAALIELDADWVMVYGDTNSTLAGALAAAKLLVPLAHVESGLRSFNRSMPEEINRVVTDHVSTVCFAPTEQAVENLHREGITGDVVVRTGDVMFDVARMFRDRAMTTSAVIADLGLTPGDFVLATVHRAENTDDPIRLESILNGLREVGNHCRVVLPLHPRTRDAAAALGLRLDGLQVTPPLGYLDMTALEVAAAIVVTDSGGVQKEAFFHGRRCVTLRDETEWVELVELGWNEVVPPTSADVVAKAILAALSAPAGESAQPYGDGHAADLIVRTLVER